MQIFTIQTGSAKKSINANVDLIQKELPKSMNGCSWISIPKAQQSSFPLWPEIIWKIWNPD